MKKPYTFFMLTGLILLQGIRLNGKPTDKGVYIHRGELIMVK